MSIWLLWQLRGNAVNTSAMSSFYRLFYAKTFPKDLEEYNDLKNQILTQVEKYEVFIDAQHLDKGMVINRNAHGEIIDHCDSLLFSSIRFVALRKLGFYSKAEDAWKAIQRSRSEGKWLRHPECAHQSTSRDMIIGLLAALTQKPEGYRSILQDLMSYLDENRGYFGDGPFYVSYLSPGLAEIIRHFSLMEDFPEDKIPPVVRYGFSTMELDTYSAKLGFELHLQALVLWIEQELRRQDILNGNRTERMRAIPGPLERLTRAFWGVKVLRERWSWLAQRLVDLDPENLFFRWLRLSSANALSTKAKLSLMRDLTKMPQFPRERLPNSCDRKADYLWQRESKEYVPEERETCLRQYNGVDFLWMAALLIPSDQSLNQTSLSTE